VVSVRYVRTSVGNRWTEVISVTSGNSGISIRRAWVGRWLVRKPPDEGGPFFAAAIVASELQVSQIDVTGTDVTGTGVARICAVGICARQP
jgi:hypothetical protein